MYYVKTVIGLSASVTWDNFNQTQLILTSASIKELPSVIRDQKKIPTAIINLRL